MVSKGIAQDSQSLKINKAKVFETLKYRPEVLVSLN